jgi:D-Tyr-tRNAtyr deacylase
VQRRDFLKSAASVSAFTLVANTSAVAQRAASAGTDRALWVEVMRRLADPVLTNLANGTLKARMPVEQAPGAERRSVFGHSSWFLP